MTTGLPSQTQVIELLGEEFARAYEEQLSQLKKQASGAGAAGPGSSPRSSLLSASVRLARNLAAASSTARASVAERSASSSIAAELGDVSKKAGIQLTGIVFHDKEVTGRNITERLMDATISGTYENVVKFLNGLQKSPNFYVVDSLELASEANTPNVLRVTMHLRTFSRTVGA